MTQTDALTFDTPEAMAAFIRDLDHPIAVEGAGTKAGIGFSRGCAPPEHHRAYWDHLFRTQGVCFGGHGRDAAFCIGSGPCGA